MYRKLNFLVGILLCACLSGYAQFNTPSIDGIVNAGEYGLDSDGANTYSTGTGDWFLTWDADFLYVAINNADQNYTGSVFLDIQPIIPVNGGVNSDGSIGAFSHPNSFSANQPFRADVILHFGASDNSYTIASGVGGWSSSIDNALTVVASNSDGGTSECSISWNLLTGGNGRPASFNWYGLRSFSCGTNCNGTLTNVPAQNPDVIINSDTGAVWNYYYFSVVDTNGGSSTLPFAATSLCYYRDDSTPGSGGYQIASSSLFDIYINDNSPDNSDNDITNHFTDNNQLCNRLLLDGTVSISRHLYIGQGSGLFPDDNTLGAISADVVMNGNNGGLYNYGRVDCNPDFVNTIAQANSRKLNFIFNGQTTIKASTNPAHNARFNDIRVQPGASLMHPSGGNAAIEIQFGDIDNSGTLNFGDGNSGEIHFSLRGDLAINNSVFLTGVGDYQFNDFVITRFGSSVAARDNGSDVQIKISGDFENYSSFIPINNGVQLNVLMNGNTRQYIKGKYNETVGNETEFYDLIIDNDNGQNDGNAMGDVGFDSDGTTPVSYFVHHAIDLNNGDLITRDRITDEIHEVAVGDLGYIDYLDCKSETTGGIPSCYIDGPVTRATNNITRVLIFPVGKSGDYRLCQMGIQQSIEQMNYYTCEMFSGDAAALGNSFPTVPATADILVDESSFRYWEMSVENNSVFNYTVNRLEYHSNLTDDEVIDPSMVRVIGAPVTGGVPWTNHSPGVSGTDPNDGWIDSQQIYSLPRHVTFGYLAPIILPIGLVNLDATWNNEDARLTWATASEINSDRFEIEYSSDGYDFDYAGSVDAAGSSQSTKIYSYDHSWWNALADAHYYRLKMVDTDGDYAYSNIVALSGRPAGEWNLFPNPSRGNVRLQLPKAYTSVNTRLINADGKLVWERLINELTGLVELSPVLPSGLYVFEVIADGESWSRPLVINR